MKNKGKVILVIVLVAIIGICLMKAFDRGETVDDVNENDKGSYSYYYSDPFISTEESSGGINFYDK